MDPLKYRRPIFVNPPFRDPLETALARRLGDSGAGIVDRILPLLDGTHSIADIYGSLAADGLSPASVSSVLEVLDELGSLSDTPQEEDETSVNGEIARYRDQIDCFEEWLEVRQGSEDSAHVGAVAAQAALGTARVVVLGLGRAGSALLECLGVAGVGTLLGIRADGDSEIEARSAEAIASRIQSLNPRTSYTEIDATGGGDLAALDEQMVSALLVYCPDTFREEVCRELNTIALAVGSSLLPYRESPFCLELGPLVVPGQTACYLCYDLRRKAAEPKAGPGEPEPSGTPALGFAAGAPLLALEIVKILTRTAFPVTRGRLWRLGLFDGSVGVHPVLKLPRCPACGVHRRTPPLRIWEE